MKYLLVIFSLFSCTIRISGSSFSLAEDAYRQNKYEEAVSLYLKGIEEEGTSPEVLYNLGNSYFKLGKDADAVLCYERAKKLDPKNKLINQNLTFVATKVADNNKASLHGRNGNVEPDAETVLDSIYRVIAIERNSNSWAVFALMAFVLFLFALALYVFTPNVLARKTGFFSGLVFLGFTVTFIVFSYLSANEFKNKDNAILMEERAELMKEPSEKSTATTSELHGGTKLKILESRKGADGQEWIKVKLNNDNIGWIRKQSVESI